MKTSIIITTYDRPRQLYACLRSIQRQNLQGIGYEILVVNDGPMDESKIVTEESDAAVGMNLRYIYTGYRNGHTWRTMGFAANIGIQQATGDIIVLSNSDIYHVGNTVRPVVLASRRDPWAISSVKQVYDDDGTLIDHLVRRPFDTLRRDQIVHQIMRGARPKGMYPTNPDMPFFLAVRREHLIKLGGYDEDFIGVASEDCDLLDRLLALGCHYVYAPDGAEAIHMYHARRTIKQLEADPGFAYNIRLRNERKGQLVRNVGKPWGELFDVKAPQRGAPIHMAMWVTSRCTMDCPRCNQQPTRLDFVDYDMPKEELDHVIQSCLARGIHFSTVEITGGEPSLWSIFEEGLRTIKESGICDRVTFITNGNDAERVAKTATDLGLYYTVSASQATPEQQELHRTYGVGVMWNTERHRDVPDAPIPGTLPALCSQRHDRNGRVVRQLIYMVGRVYYCCLAYACSTVTGEDPRLSCPFDEDFPTFFVDKQFDLPICSACICNKKVWDQIPASQGTP